jgi:hypothetical protein
MARKRLHRFLPYGKVAPQPRSRAMADLNSLTQIAEAQIALNFRMAKATRSEFAEIHAEQQRIRAAAAALLQGKVA